MKYEKFKNESESESETQKFEYDLIIEHISMRVIQGINLKFIIGFHQNEEYFVEKQLLSYYD